MNDEKPENKKRKWPIRWYRAIMDWRVWKDWSWWVKIIAVIWMLLPFPHLYEILKIWLPWIHPLLGKIGIDLPELAQKEQIQSLFDQVRTSMLVIAAWYGVFFLIWRTILADRQTRSTEMQTQTVRESHHTDLFTKAVEQLGATRQDGEPAIETRIGAIYVLERIAKDSERDYGPIIETLAAYICEHCRDPKFFDDKELAHVQQEWLQLLDTDNDWPFVELDQARRKWIDSLRKKPPADRSDVAVALTVLSRREKNRNWTSKSEGETQPDFTGANFQGATLWNKIEGLVRDGTNLRLTHLEGAELSDVDLSGANLDEANLSGANLHKANLSNADLIRANLLGTYLLDANLSNANLIDANLSCAELPGTNLSGANLSVTDLSGANLSVTDLSGAEFWEARLIGADLEKAKLIGANLAEADLSKADLTDANLSGAKLDRTNLSDAKLMRADLSNALLVGAKLKDSKGLTDDMLEQALGDVNTPLPNGLTRPASWGSREDAIKKWETFCEEERRRFRQSIGFNDD